MIESIVRPIDPERDLPTLDERVLRLPEWRRRKALSFAFPLDRLQCALAYELLAGLLRNKCGITDFGLEYDSYGKPSVKGRTDIHISISHCRKAVMAVVSDRPVGCDVEEIRSSDNVDNAMIADYCYSAVEKRLIAEADNPSVEFTRIWTAKEALFKMDNTLDLENLDTRAETPGCHVMTEIFCGYIATIAAKD